MNLNDVKSCAVAGLSGGSGKSVVSVALIAALRQKGASVVPFKKGPDYIDAGWLTAAAQHTCYNLDPYLMDSATIQTSYQGHIHGHDYAIIEGNRGLYDGVNLEGEYSTAALANFLNLPVLLVVNCSKVTRTVGALILGCCQFDQELAFSGVILNQIATPRHETLVRSSIETYTPLTVLGIVPRIQEDIFPMRHLGVVPLQEYEEARSTVERLAELALEHFDLHCITERMSSIKPNTAWHFEKILHQNRVTIGVVRDIAFHFYYQENLEYLRREGAELVFIDALQTDKIPENLDGLYIGGGFPETNARRLAENASFRASLKQMIARGLPVYAECGGLIYLGQSLEIEGQEYPMTGVFPVRFGLSQKPQAHGYSACTVTGDTCFYEKGTVIKGHEFRYSTVKSWAGRTEELVVEMERGTGFLGGRDGLVTNNTLAMYTHVLAPGTPEWAVGLVRAARMYTS